jgi:hypothetical protein
LPRLFYVESLAPVGDAQPEFLGPRGKIQVEAPVLALAVLQIFPNDQACLRLVAALAMEWAEERTTGKRYLDLELLSP